ncbi:hypothetical protein AVL50_31840 [Flammeovirga sp. SJP92]|nr:hypothetical protein AVL50_31840 [Flammeovirga sp. SJP92]
MDDHGIPLRDTLLDLIERKTTVFQPCREMIYQTKFSDKNNEIISSGRIKMMATGRKWKFQPEKQVEVALQYEYTAEDYEKCKEHQLNTKLGFDHWINEATEGVIENVEKVWMHPFRFNQYTFTEVAPFPEVIFPLSIGKSWTGRLSLQEGWGDWENSSGSFKYKVVARENIGTKYAEIQNCWKIESKATYSFGESKLNYWFHEELGFVKFEYLNYGHQKLMIELAEVH